MSNKTYFADTSVVYYRLHGHTLQAEAVRAAVKSDTLAVSNFVRGDYIRGYIIGLIDLYCAIKEEASVEDGITLFRAETDTRPRTLGAALRSVTGWLCGFEDWQDPLKTLRRLGEHIRLKLTEFDMRFPVRAPDPMECEIGVLAFRRETYDEQLLFDFLSEFETIRDAPSCNQCGFRKEQTNRLAQEKIDLYSDQQRSTHHASKDYVEQAEWIEKAVKSDLARPSCGYCNRLGNTIFALSAPSEATILTGDAQSFPALAVILGKSLHVLPPLVQLRADRENRRG